LQKKKGKGKMMKKSDAIVRPSGQLVKGARSMIGGALGIALLWASTSSATATFVTDIEKIPFTSIVPIAQTTAPERVLFSGNLDLATVVAPPSGSCTADSPCSLPGSVIVLASGINGIGLKSGLRYQLFGVALQTKNLQIPGSTVVPAQLIVILPVPVRPVGTLVVKVPIKVVVTFSADGHILLAAAPPLGISSWWQAEGTAADALNINPGTLSMTEAVGFVPGKTGQAFQFANQGFVEVPSSPSLEPATLTVGAWVRGTAPGSFGHILSKGAANCDGGSYALYTGLSGGLLFYVSDGTTFGVSPDAGTAIWDGNWHFVAGTFDGSTVRLYVDGTEVGTGTPAPITINYSLPTNDSFYIGAYRGTCEFRFNGDVDGVQLFGRALSSIEVLGLYNAGN
jgi:hypothetical protein